MPWISGFQIQNTEHSHQNTHWAELPNWKQRPCISRKHICQCFQCKWCYTMFAVNHLPQLEPHALCFLQLGLQKTVPHPKKGRTDKKKNTYLSMAPDLATAHLPFFFLTRGRQSDGGISVWYTFAKSNGWCAQDVQHKPNACCETLRPRQHSWQNIEDFWVIDWKPSVTVGVALVEGGNAPPPS